MTIPQHPLPDHALSAIAWEASERKPCVTLQLDVQFFAAVHPGQFVAARGRVVRKTGSLVFMRGSLLVEGAEVAAASMILKVLGGSGGGDTPADSPSMPA